MTPEERRAKASKAAQARWNNGRPHAVIKPAAPAVVHGEQPDCITWEERFDRLWGRIHGADTHNTNRRIRRTAA